MAERRPHRVATLRAWLASPVPAAPLVFFRVAFASALLWDVWRYASSGWIKELWIDPGFHFQYLGFAFVRPWSGDGMYWHFAALAVAALAMLVGIAYRVAAIVFCLGFTYVFLLDQAQYLNHFYLICLLAGLACFVSPHREGSLAALLWPAWRRRDVPRWQLLLLRFQVGVVYVYAGIAKLETDWLSGAPLALWLSRHAAHLPEFAEVPDVALVASWAGLCFDLAIVPALLWRRTRVVAFVAAVLFHTTNALVFSIGIFPWLMIAMTALFFPAERWDALARRCGVLATRRRTDSTPRPLARPALAALVLYATLQLAVPLRHWAYAGPVTWTEEGHRFAWRMKLRDKIGHARYRVETPSGALIAQVDPADWLNRFQVRTMVGRPDMLLQFAHHLSAEYERMGHPAVRIRVVSDVCLNGREAQPLVRPEVDLAAEPRGLAASRWIARAPAGRARLLPRRPTCGSATG